MHIFTILLLPLSFLRLSWLAFEYYVCFYKLIVYYMYTCACMYDEKKKTRKFKTKYANISYFHIYFRICKVHDTIPNLFVLSVFSFYKLAPFSMPSKYKEHILPFCQIIFSMPSRKTPPCLQDCADRLSSHQATPTQARIPRGMFIYVSIATLSLLPVPVNYNDFIHSV